MTSGDTIDSSSSKALGMASVIATYDAFRVDLHRDGLRIVRLICVVTTGLAWLLWVASAGFVLWAVRSLVGGPGWGSVLWCAAALPIGVCALLVGTMLRQGVARVGEDDDLLQSIVATDKARRPGEKWPGQHEFHADASMLLAHIDMAFPEGSTQSGASRPPPAGLDLLSALALLDNVGAHGLAFHEKWLAPELVAGMQASADPPDT